MNVKVTVKAQMHENKAFYEGGEAWKPKGVTHFSIEHVDADIVMYASDKVVTESLIEQLESFSSDLEKYTYIDHEIIFSEAKIAGVDFSESLSKIMNLSLKQN